MCNFDRLRSCAKKEKRSIRYLCELVGRGHSFIVDCEKGRSVVTPEIVEAWAAALNTSAAYLMDETDDPAPGFGQNKKPAGDGGLGVFAVLNELNEENRERLLKIAAVFLEDQRRSE